MVKNTLSNILATTVPVDLEYFGKKIVLNFNRLSIQHQDYFHKRFGGKAEFDRRASELDIEVLHPVMFSLLPDMEKDKLNQLKEFFVQTDENGNKFSLAGTTYEIFRATIGANISNCHDIIMACSGMDKVQKQLDGLSDDKKKEIMTEIEKLITPSSSPKSPNKQVGQLKKLAT